MPIAAWAFTTVQLSKERRIVQIRHGAREAFSCLFHGICPAVCEEARGQRVDAEGIRDRLKVGFLINDDPFGIRHGVSPFILLSVIDDQYVPEVPEG